MILAALRSLFLPEQNKGESQAEQFSDSQHNPPINNDQPGLNSPRRINGNTDGSSSQKSQRKRKVLYDEVELAQHPDTCQSKRKGTADVMPVNDASVPIGARIVNKNEEMGTANELVASCTSMQQQRDDARKERDAAVQKAKRMDAKVRKLVERGKTLRQQRDNERRKRSAAMRETRRQNRAYKKTIRSLKRDAKRLKQNKQEMIWDICKKNGVIDKLERERDAAIQKNGDIDTLQREMNAAHAELRRLECPICLAVNKDPYVHLCGHLICSNCIDRFHFGSPCPVCKCEISGRVKAFF